jgi:Yip1-like protein
MGGEASFKQVLAVVVSAGAVSALGTVFTGPLNYFRGAVGSATNLRVLLPMVDEKSFVGRLLGMADLFVIWWLVVLAIGIAVLYRRRTQPIAIALLGLYAVIALAVAAFMSGAGG